MKNLLLILTVLFCQSSFGQWYQVNSNTTTDLYDIFFIDSLTGYCVGGTGGFTGVPAGTSVILETTDGGENWTTIFTQDSLLILHVAVITENEDSKFLAYARKNNESFKLSAVVSEAELNFAVEPISYEPRVLRIYNNEIYFMDGLDDLNLKRLVDDENNEVEFLHSDIGYFNVNSSGIIAFRDNMVNMMKSLDFGSTWTDVQHPEILDERSNLAMFQDTIIFTTWYGPATVFSYDNGLTWDYYAGGPYPKTLIVSPMVLFTYYNDGADVKYTNNTGESWEVLGNYSVNKLYIKNGKGFMVGPEGYIYKLDNVGALGINEPLKTNMKIYPNPSSNYVTLDFADAVAISSIELVDMNGKVVKTYTTNQTQLDLTDVASGVYILKVETEMGLVSKRIIVP